MIKSKSFTVSGRIAARHRMKELSREEASYWCKNCLFKKKSKPV